MATVWTGFSEEEQNKIKAELSQVPGHQVINEIQKKTPSSITALKDNNKANIPKKVESNRALQTSQQKDAFPIPIDALLSPRLKQEKSTEAPAVVKLKIVEDSSFEIMETAPIANNPDACKEENQKNDEPKPATESITHSPEGSPSLTLKSEVIKMENKDPMNLEEFEKKRKAIEEQNRLRKQMLAKALAMRKMKTQAEAHKLQQIQEELTKLDISLSNDVSILRNHIELASTDLAEAERRYTKAEREFIEAKQLLFTKRERKDLLTEHLYAIIEQNEIRKAHRLTDLMVQLSEEDPSIEITLNQVAEAEPVSNTSDKTADV